MQRSRKYVLDVLFFLLLIGLASAKHHNFDLSPATLVFHDPEFFKDPGYLIGYLACWNFLFEISLIIIIHFKQHPNHIVEHATINFLVVGGQLINNIAFFINHSCQNFFFATESLILALILMQTGFGLALNKKLLSDELLPGIFILRTLHRTFGHLIYLLTKIQICIYMYYFFSDSVILPVFSVMLLLLLTSVNHVILTTVLSKRKTNLMEVTKFLIDDSGQNQHYFDLLKSIESGDIVLEEDDFVLTSGLSDFSNEMAAEFTPPKIDWVIIENRVFDITNLRHPKGNYILKAINRRDVTRQIYGIKSWRFENREIDYRKKTKHAHVVRTFEFLADHCIGEIPLSPVIVSTAESARTSSKSAYTVNLFHAGMEDRKEVLARTQGWRTQQIHPLDEAAKVRLLLVSKHDEKYITNLSSYWLKNFGKYFFVRKSETELSYFYVVMSLSPRYLSEKQKWLGKLQAGASVEFLRNFERVYSDIYGLNSILSKGLSEKMRSAVEARDDLLEAFLPIVEVSQSPETKFDKSVEFSLHGPLGTGLGFTGSTTKRILLAIKDDGVIPLLDFFEFLSQRALIELNGGKPSHPVFGQEYLLSYPNSPEFFVYWEISDSFLEPAEVLGLSALKLISRLQAGLQSGEFQDAKSKVCEMVKRVTIVTNKSQFQSQKGSLAFSSIKGYDFKTIKDLASNESFGRIEMAVVSGPSNFVERVLLNADLRPTQIEIL